ncbi:MAG: class II glutamine amidotransferase [Hyphomicrobiales bacterium]|nr:class II glutamine amidotransferase [Hyphomicrobiales bacterium]
MCELFAISCALPTTVSFTLGEFQKHGGQNHHNRDGWGVVFYDEEDARVIREAEAADHSIHLDFIRDHAYPSTTMISHIRDANAGGVKLKNTHPFTRELWGNLHSFAHKGELDDDEEDGDTARNFLPIGETDSEAAFCALMETMKERWIARGRIPELEERLEVVSSFARTYRERGTFNFLYCDGEYLFAHSHQRHHPDGELKPPGLNILERDNHHPDETDHHDVAGLHLPDQAHHQAMTLVASVPLTEEAWHPLAGGTLAVLSQGVVQGMYGV